MAVRGDEDHVFQIVSVRPDRKPRLVGDDHSGAQLRRDIFTALDSDSVNVPHSLSSGEDRVGRGAAVRRHHVVLQLAYRLDACGSHRGDRDAVAHRIEPRFVAGDQEIPRLGLTLRETPGHGKRASDVRPIGPSRATDVDSDELSGSSDPIALVVAEKGPGQ